ncbi:nuclear transport factor 2 family protein [Sneathiella marina]|uniref:Nuclear transport factor 2 family protein n=1 Tax=Sneathiella marina TaxID=2950108 RepID=A0ABY4W8J1_9PROT|nr:nuclear transport factor 2 family protein [Sneathiella marina]USG63166.1 nuclear transport factor 2 family protein [Sneathiella marina]
MTPEEQAVQTANDNFYQATNDMFKGDLSLMTKVWSHEDDVIYMSPDGKYLTGWDQVLADWQTQADMKLGGTLRTTQSRINVGKGYAFTHSVEVGENEVDGSKVKVSIRATKIFRKQKDGWKLISLHTDLLPFLRD